MGKKYKIEIQRPIVMLSEMNPVKRGVLRRLANNTRGKIYVANERMTGGVPYTINPNHARMFFNESLAEKYINKMEVKSLARASDYRGL